MRSVTAIGVPERLVHSVKVSYREERERERGREGERERESS